MENKFVKAYCARTKQYFWLEMKNVGGAWRVVNMIRISEGEARVLSSEVNRPTFETNTNLIPCAGCGSRRVGGCSCAKRAHSCSGGMKYQFDCIYCDEFKIDYSMPSASDVEGRVGDTIMLAQGQEAKIRGADNRPLSKIVVGVGWDPASGADNMDVDSSAVVMDPADRTDLVYFGNLKHPSGCVLHHGDNLTGAGGIQDGDDENITVYLDRVPADKDRLVFVLNIYQCDLRRQTLDGVRNLYIKLYDPDSKKALIQYDVRGNTGDHTAMVIGMAYRDGNGWSFKAIGKSLRVSDVRQLERVCKKYLI